MTVLQTLLRMFPFPTRTGLIEIGTPCGDSPVLLTCNFRLTVERVRRALEGIDAYLLVANSRGVNVWCSAAGGLLTNHDVASVLRTSGVERLVHHRRVILPQLAAPGIEAEWIRRRTGWDVIWGPVHAESIGAFLNAGFIKTAEMRTVSFRWPHRLEMAIAWAFPLSLVSLLVFPFWREGVLPLVGLIWGSSLVIFLGFPLYQSHLRVTRERGVVLFLWLLCMIGLTACSALAGDLSWVTILRWGIASLVVLLILGLDLTGSTPIFKSGLHEDRRLRIELDEDRCRGAGYCEQVCPRCVYEVDFDRRKATLPGTEHCVQCGACVVQCPFDALHFVSPSGDVVTADVVRRFKLNLLGSRRQRPSERESE